jgi:hypothetical protein
MNPLLHLILSLTTTLIDGLTDRTLKNARKNLTAASDNPVFLISFSIALSFTNGKAPITSATPTYHHALVSTSQDVDEVGNRLVR